MKKYLSIIVGLMLVIGALPVLAANDVTISPNVEISVSGYTLVVVGTDKIIDSLSVADSNFTVTLSPGSTFSVTSANKRKFSYSVGTGITAATHCTGDSYVAFAASSASTAAADVTVTPSTTETCDGVATAVVTGGSSGGGGSGGGNNPNANIFGQTAAAAVPATTAVQLPVQASPIAAVAIGAAAVRHTFSAALKLGVTSADVTELQKRLAEEGVYSGPVTGYFGSLTQAAVKKYQEKEGIATAGQAGYGNVGPMTRARLNASVSAAVSTPVVTAPATQLSSAQIEAIQTQLQTLQAQLLLLLSQQLELLNAGQ